MWTLFLKARHNLCIRVSLQSTRGKAALMVNIVQSQILKIKIFSLPKFGHVNLRLCSAAGQGVTNQKIMFVPVTCTLDEKVAPTYVKVCVCVCV